METLLQKLEAVIDEVIRLTEGLAVPTGDAQKLYLVALHARVLELAVGSLCLYKTDNPSCVPVLLRAQIEAYADLMNLTDTIDYLKYMQVAWLSQKEVILRKAVERGSNNKYLKDLAMSTDLPAAYEAVKRKIQEMKDDGFQELKIWKRFDRASLREIFDSVYPLLCYHSHNNLNIIESRHLDRSGDQLRVSIFRTGNAEEEVHIIDTIAGVVVDSMLQIWAKLGNDTSTTVSLTNRLEELRSLY